MTTATEPVGVFQVFRLNTAIFVLKIWIRWAAFKIGSLEEVAMAAPWFKDSALAKIFDYIMWNLAVLQFELIFFSSYTIGINKYIIFEITGVSFLFTINFNKL